MAVTTTPRMILNAAYAKSMKNKPGQIATESGELLELVNRSMRGIYAFAARVNPMHFAETSDVAYVAASNGWPRPEAAESIFLIELASDGTEVAVVPFDHQAAEPHMPAVYEFGKVFRIAKGDGPETSDTLRFYYSKRPKTATGLNDTLDPLWDEQCNELLILDVAIYLAMKDGRDEEIGGLRTERDNWAKIFVAHLEHATANERRAFGHIRRFNTNTLVPVASLLAGGSNVTV